MMNILKGIETLGNKINFLFFGYEKGSKFSSWLTILSATGLLILVIAKFDSFIYSWENLKVYLNNL